MTAELDEVKITQVFTNLVENAIKYNKEHGWVKVLLDADHQFFTVEISDSGIGIPESDYDHILSGFTGWINPIPGKSEGRAWGLPSPEMRCCFTGVPLR